MKQGLKRAGIAIVVLLVVAQFFRPSYSNPESSADNEFTHKITVPPEIAQTLNQACGDCHSNQTVWPWYSKIAPLSWWIAHHVKEGRRELNLSEWTYSDDRIRRKLEAIAGEVKEGDMPPGYYVPMHANARLTDAQRTAIIDWATTELTRRGGPLPRRNRPH
jgi:cytochrome c551/c552